jgi:hypothetical protein
MTTRLTRTAATAATTALLIVASALPAAARPDPGDPLPPQSSRCPLQRIGRQLVRCDNLTGAGVSAPSWVPQL